MRFFKTISSAAALLFVLALPVAAQQKYDPVTGAALVKCTAGCTGSGGGGTSSNFGSVFPTSGTAAGFKNAGGNMDWGLVDASHFLEVNVAASVLPTGAALDSSLQSILTALGAAPMQQTGGSVFVAPTAASGAGISPTASGAAESSHVLKGSAGNLYTLTVTIGATTGYLMLFDATSAPADG